MKEPLPIEKQLQEENEALKTARLCDAKHWEDRLAVAYETIERLLSRQELARRIMEPLKECDPVIREWLTVTSNDAKLSPLNKGDGDGQSNC